MSSLAMQQSVQAFYLSLFGRAADPEGYKYWVSQLDSGAVELDGVLSAMLQSSEFSERREALLASDGERWISEIYQSVLGREVEKEGADYWTSLLSEGVAPQTIIQSILAAASGTDNEALVASTSIAKFYSENVTNSEYNADQQLIQQGFRSNEQLYTDLTALDANYETLSLSQVGQSVEGRPLYSATVGEGPRKLMIVTQQHGDELTGTEASMHLLEWLSGDSDAAQALREQVTLTVMPRVNPDGFARWEGLVAGELDPATTLDPRRNAEDIDLNRTWDSSEAIDASLVPETTAVREVVQAFQPELILDYHNQNNYINEAGELETLSVLWPTNENVGPTITATAQQAAVAISQGLDDFDYGHLSLFPGGDSPQIGRNGIAIDGTPVLLIEQRGLEEFELKSLEGLDLDFDAVASAIVLEGVLSMLGVIEAMGQGDFDSLDPLLATLIPDRGERINFDDIYAEEIAWDDDIAQPVQENIAAELDALQGAASIAGVADPLSQELLVA